MEIQQHIKRLQKKEKQVVNQWVRKARDCARAAGYLSGGQTIAKVIGATLEDAEVVTLCRKAHYADVMSSRLANKTSRMLYILRRR